eukprot:5811865-Pyramimonas_sp.AAC.1
MSPRLAKMQLETRGFLRDGIEAGALLDTWGANFRRQWAERRVELDVRVCPRLRQRQCILHGSAGVVEVEI